MHNIADYILDVASTRRVMPWTAFREAFDHLCAITPAQETIELDQIRRLRRQVVRNLDSLGHCDFDFTVSNGLVYAAPPTLARLPYTISEAVLCGARAPGTVARVSHVIGQVEPSCQVLVQEDRGQPAVAPARILVRCGSTKQLESVAATLGIAFSAVPPAWLFASLAPSLHDVTDRCTWRATQEPNWPLRDFDSETCTFRIRTGSPGGERPRLTSYRNPRTKQYLTMIWAGGHCAEIERDWGRYWLLSRHGKQVIRYDERHLILSVSAGAPLPRLYARALSLCAGAPPESTVGLTEELEEPTSDIRVNYRSVPPQIAHRISEKLGQAANLTSNSTLASKA